MHIHIGDCWVLPNFRRECGWPGISERQCEQRGCCFNSNTSGVTWCFHKANGKCCYCKLYINKHQLSLIYIQYWCIDGKYIIQMARLRNGGKMSFRESFHLFRAEPHKFYIYRQYTNIVFIMQ